MKKIYLLMLIFIALGFTACSKETPELTSGATNKYDKLEAARTKADEQFSKLKENDNNGKVIRTVRPDVAKFVEEEFSEKNTQNKKLDNFEYNINSKAMSTIFKNQAKHIFNTVKYKYEINIEKLEKYYKVEDFVKLLSKNDSKLKTVEMKKFDTVLVRNIDDNSYTSELHAIYSIENDSYYLKFSSKDMSIAEIIMLAEKFINEN